MQKLFVALFLACTTFISPAFVWASSPPPRKTLAERVELATNVIIGTAKKVRVLELKDGKLQEVKPEPKNISPFGEVAEVTIEVDEVLYPLSWKPKKTVRYLFGGGHFEVERIRNDTVGKKLIYLMKLNEYGELKNESDIFFPSYEWHLAESLDKKADIQAVLETRGKREAETKKKEPTEK